MSDPPSQEATAWQASDEIRTQKTWLVLEHLGARRGERLYNASMHHKRLMMSGITAFGRETPPNIPEMIGCVPRNRHDSARLLDYSV